MQPKPSADLLAELRELGSGPVAGSAMGELEKPVTLPQPRAVGGGQAGIDHHKAPDP